MSEWQPIETAPKDGTWVLVLAYPSKVPAVARFHDGGWQEDENQVPANLYEWPLTHWQHFPTLPKGDT